MGTGGESYKHLNRLGLIVRHGKGMELVRELQLQLGPLTGVGGGVPMSPVDFKKSQCHMSLSLIYSHVPGQI